MPLHPWTPTLKYDVVELVPETLTGRFFRLRLDSDDSTDDPAYD